MAKFSIESFVRSTVCGKIINKKFIYRGDFGSPPVFYSMNFIFSIRSLFVLMHLVDKGALPPELLLLSQLFPLGVDGRPVR